MYRIMIAFLLIAGATPLSGQDQIKGREIPPLILLIQNNASLQVITNFVEKHPESISQPSFDWGGKNAGTPLQEACHADRKDVVAYLLSKGADPNSKNAADKTPIFNAVVLSDTATIQMLLDHGADINWRAYGLFPPIFDLLGACGYENGKQDQVMEKNLRFILPLIALPDEDISFLIKMVRSIKDITPPPVLASHLRKLEIVQQFLRNNGRIHQALNEFLASSPEKRR